MLDNFHQIEAEMDPKDLVYYDEYVQSRVIFSNLDMALDIFRCYNLTPNPRHHKERQQL